MAGLVHSIEELVGRTPLMELNRFERQQQCGAHLLAKLEFFNPTGSVKDRAALSMLNAAEEAGLLKPGGTIVEQTSGNTGIGLAAFAAERGYKLDIFLERGASLERLCTQRCRWAADRRIRERTSWSSSRTTA